MESNDIVFITLVSSLFLLIIVGFFIAFISLYQKRQKQNELDQIRLQEQFNQEVLNTQLELKEQVFRQISQEIHDNIGQSLTVAKMQLNFIQDSENFEKAKTAKELITRSLQDLRDLSRSLNGNYIIREGFEASLKREASYIENSGSFSCTVHGTFPMGFTSPNSEIILFRCVQECLSNAVKYSKGSEISINMSANEEEFKLEVVDNGIGFPDNWRENQCVGMDSLAKRVEVLQGRLIINTNKGQGSKICIILRAENKLQIA